MSDEFPPKDETPHNHHGSAEENKKKITDATQPGDPEQPTKPAPQKNPNPRAPLPRDPSGGRPANG